MKTILDNNFFTLYELERDDHRALCKFKVKPDFEPYRGTNKEIPIDDAIIISSSCPAVYRLEFYGPGSNKKLDNDTFYIDNSIVDALATGKSIRKMQEFSQYTLISKDGRKEKATCREFAISQVANLFYDVVVYVGDAPYEIPTWTGATASPYENDCIRLHFSKTDPLSVGWVLLYFRLLLRPNSFTLTKKQKEAFYKPDLEKARKEITSGIDNWVEFLRSYK